MTRRTRNWAKALASDGIERLFFSLVAVPTAIAEHFLRLSLTGVAMLLYAGVPIAMLFAFFVYTQAFLGAYLRQFINLLIETFMSVIIVAIMIGLLVAAAQQGIGLYIGASIITFIVILWRIKSALKLGTAAIDLFGGGSLTGGAGGMDVVRMGRQAVGGAAAIAGAALTGGATVAAGGAVLAGAAALQADGNRGRRLSGHRPRQNRRSGAAVKKPSPAIPWAVQRRLATSLKVPMKPVPWSATFVMGTCSRTNPICWTICRAGSSMSGFGSSPWLAMRTSPSLRDAFDQIGGSRYGIARDAAFDGDGEPVNLPAGNGRAAQSLNNGMSPDNAQPAGSDNNAPWRREPATPRQLAYLSQLGGEIPDNLTRGQASDLITQIRNRANETAETSSNGETNGQQLNHDLLNRFASLEQAIHARTQTLTDPETAVQTGNRQPQEAVNGPIPDWLREEDGQSPGEAAQDVRLVSADPDADDDKDAGDPQNVNIVSAAPDLDRDGREDKYEILDSHTAGIIRLEPYQDSRRQVIHDTLARLEEPQSPDGQAAHKTLLIYTGEQNTRLLQGAVDQHTATAVQEATTATADLVTQYRQQGLNDAEQLTAFQSGEATAAIREVLDTPLSDEQLSAVADMVMLPQRRLTRTELVAVIGREAAAGATDEGAVVQAIGSPIGFGRADGQRARRAGRRPGDEFIPGRTGPPGGDDSRWPA